MSTYTRVAIAILTFVLLAGCGKAGSTVLSTATVIPPTATLEPVATPLSTPTPVPTLGLGSTRVREVDSMVMVYAPAGTFMMGSLPTDGDSPYPNEFPAHEVSVDAFWLDRAEVTNAQYRLCVEAGVCNPPQDTGSHARESYYGDSGFDDYPVIYVTWYQAVAYCSWAGARLPMEAEWAYAARGPERKIYPWGDEFDGKRLNYCDVNCDRPFPDRGTDDGYSDTSPVGNYPSGASWVSAFDMLGNVWEWVWEWHYYFEGHDWNEHPNSIPPNTYRVLRGGAWDTNKGHARNAFRNWLTPTDSGDSIGFRCAGDIASEAMPEIQPSTQGECACLITQ